MPMPVSGCRKSLFFRNVAYSQTLTPNPFPSVKGCVCFVGSASCRAFGHTRPASVPGLNVGLPPSPRLGLRPKQGRFGCLPKVLHDAKPTKQATLDTPFLIMIEVFRQPEAANYICSQLMSIHTSPHLFCSFSLSFINPTKLSGLITLTQGPKDNTRITISVSSVA